MSLQRLRDEHRELYRLGDELIEAAGARPPCISALVAARRTLSQAVLQHMAHEARVALAPLAASSDPADQLIARRYTGELLTMRQESSAHIARWTTAAIEADPAAYLRGTRRLLEAMAARGEWEEMVFFPAVERLLARSGAFRKTG